MAWYEMVDGTKKFLLPDAAARSRSSIRRKLPGVPAQSAPRRSEASRKEELVKLAQAALEADTVTAMRDALGKLPGTTARGSKEELIEKLQEFIARNG